MEVLPIYMMPVRSAFLLFILFSFVGWCSEVLYVGLFFEHKFVNRGFLNGPLCPIYGFGGAVILLLPQSLYSTWIPLFFFSLILCTVVEYFISWLLEKMFHTLWWDYSHYKFNIKGRVCLLNSFLFGLMGMIGGHFIFPYAEFAVTFLDSKWIRLISDVIAAVLVVDIIHTTKQLVDFNTAMERLKAFREIVQHLEVKKNETNQRIMERIESIQNTRHAAIEKFIKRFPTMKSVHYKEEIKLFKDRIHSKLTKLK